eukprot:scaffold124294_cov60-Phaeocystis_antarctica.AAC.2
MECEAQAGRCRVVGPGSGAPWGGAGRQVVRRPGTGTILQPAVLDRSSNSIQGGVHNLRNARRGIVSTRGPAAKPINQVLVAPSARETSQAASPSPGRAAVRPPSHTRGGLGYQAAPPPPERAAVFLGCRTMLASVRLRLGCDIEGRRLPRSPAVEG